MDKTVLLLRELKEHPDLTQRQLAERLTVSLGTVNSLIKNAPGSTATTEADKAREIDEFLAPYKVDNAVIMAAGFGSRFVPLTWETPKGLLEVFGERMVEREIRQLKEVGINNISIVVGYLKEKFEYLIDKYGVKLIYNPDYSRMNNISTLHWAKDEFIGHNTYLLVSDNWLRDNMFHAYEPCAWYSSSFIAGPTSEWCLTYNKKGLITDVHVGGADSYVMFGPIYFSREFSDRFFPEIERYYKLPGHEQDYWEDVFVDWVHGDCGLKKSECPELYINRQPDGQVYEFENLEELRAFDERYIHSSDNEAMAIISKVFDVPESEVHDIKCLKSGMTNRSFSFTLAGNASPALEGDASSAAGNASSAADNASSATGNAYICRVPGEGTSLLINRSEEGENLAAVAPLGISEEVKYYNPETGYKISRFYEGARVADPHSEEDMRACMQLLRRFHNSNLKVEHDFDIAERLDFYENLCITNGGIPFEDYREVRANSRRLLEILKKLNHPKGFTHVDAVPDNFLFITEISQNSDDDILSGNVSFGRAAHDNKEKQGGASRFAALGNCPVKQSSPSLCEICEDIKLIDYEYAGMADQLIDLAMCSIYAYYNKEQTDKLTDMYFATEYISCSGDKTVINECDDEARGTIYAYMALGGLLWALWAVYKSSLGVSFGEYTLIQYRYAKDFYKEAVKLIG